MKHNFIARLNHVEPKLSLFVIEVTQQCNFRCRYCCYSGQYNERRTHSNSFMSPHTVEETIRFIIKYHSDERRTRVTFYGGESLLALDIIKKSVQQLGDLLGDNVEFGISTNAYLLTKEVVDWICKIPRCCVFVTIDGDKATHDANRVTVSGLNTYERILSNLKYFSDTYPQQYQERVDYLVTLERYNQLVGISDFMRRDRFLGLKVPIHLSFVLPRNKVERGLSEEQRLDFINLLDEAYTRYCQKEHSLLVNKFIEWTDIFDSSLATDIVVTTCADDMYRLFISTEGDIYLCERMNKQYKLGTLSDDIIEIRDEAEILKRKFIDRRNKICRNCNVAVWCTMCMTSLNYSDNELADLCKKEQEIIPIVKEYAKMRQRHDRMKEMGEKTSKMHI